MELILLQKEEELKCLEQQLKVALQWEADMDYEYAALLYPAIGTLKREIEKLKEFQQVSETSAPDNFIGYINQLLSGELHAMEIHADINTWEKNHDLTILTIARMKTKSTLLCKIVANDMLEYFLPWNFTQDLKHIGWKHIKTGNYFKIKSVIKNTESMEEFDRLIARTMMEPFSPLLKSSERHFYKLIPNGTADDETINNRIK